MAVGAFRLLGIWAIVIVALALFLGFFLVFLTAPLVPLGLFYLIFLFLRGQTARRERRHALLAHEADERQRLLDRVLPPPRGIRA